MKTTHTLSGVKLLSKGGSLIFCENCKKIIGSINKNGYRYINISVVCSCGNYGSVEIARPDSTADPFEKVRNIPNEKNGVQVCQNCETPIFGIIASRVRTYSFYAECICGEKYDLKSNSAKRLGETARLLKLKRIYTLKNDET